MAYVSNYDSVLDISYGKDALLDGLLLHFMTENDLENSINPEKNASPEQIRFMVALREGEFYAPCSDWMFLMLLKQGLPRPLLHEYTEQWKVFVRLAKEYCKDRYLARRFIALARHKFRMTLASPIVIPSRLLKRLMTIFMSQSGVDDPYRERRMELNRIASELVNSPAFDKVVNRCPEEVMACRRIDDLRFRMDMLEIERLMRLSTLTDHWKVEQFTPKSIEKCGLEAEIKASPGLFSSVAAALGRHGETPKRVLYLPNRAGGLMFDLEVVKTLLRTGHRVVMAFKEGFYFDDPVFWDRYHDPVLGEALKDAYFVSDDNLSKNQLLDVINRHPFVVISDGSRERFNPYRMSVTFARAWKECDLVLAKGAGIYNRVIQASHEFTRDIVCFFRDPYGHFHLHFRERARWVHKFSQDYIEGKADEIIGEMREAKRKGHTVMFYSGIIGSVPGQTDMAIRIMTAFVTHLREQLDATYIINPAEHFEEGMDGDDLMFMWEKVQRSGYINVWRFQSYFDIEKSFGLLGKKVPPVWTGKDATYSTGCTKEMHIALDVQRRHPELQIIGPSPEKFFRRREYGVGKYFDAGIRE
ncbi:ARMT1-like domain-containing protein [Pseudodesulfovibrio tunisiensis]|uniref:ARMT1-like domain-containing protein n=1 Tax=Pseudodesulfovibrio tunisiensis TaxID=463192 RepID=UPI001FB3248F|nr:ARMT1-like domain-containing protein [Pseudodesulfovibrio tunisiensis]